MKPLSPSNRFRQRRRGGQTLVEGALVVTFILLPLTLGIIQFGIVMNAISSLQMIGREAGRFAAVHGQEQTSDDSVSQSSPPSILNYIRTVCTGTGINYSDLTISVSPSMGSTSRVSGLPITVTLSYPMSKKVFVGKILGATSILANNYTVTSTFVLE
jgi:Flp pilus assembly protein TadG